MHILVTAPIPSHPQNHGNRARVFALCKALQDAGAVIHYVYGGLEGLTEDQELAMRRTWDHVYILPPLTAEIAPHKRPPTGKGGYGIDDWYRDEITSVTNRIMSIWNIKYCIANYVWYSRWLESVPSHIPKYIDTHDVFANRHARLAADGVAPNWFSTSVKEEAKALSRASKVLAIQDSEAEHFKALSNTPVVTLGHFIDPDFLPSKPVKNRKPVAGLIASDNPINQSSLWALDSELSKRPEVIARYDLRLAGALSNSPAADNTHFKKLGFIESVEDFYQECDLILNPNIGGTGLKIKSVEALSYGKALIATEDAMVGINSNHPLQNCQDIAAFCNAMATLDAEKDIAGLEAAGRETIQAYTARQQAALAELFPLLFAAEAS